MLLSAGAAAVTVATVRHRLTLVAVTGRSMSPTIQPGQRVLVDRRRVYQRGDVVVVYSPLIEQSRWRVESGSRRKQEEFFIKRVAAMAGDKLPGSLDDSGVGTVPAGHVVLFGDGRGSLDSNNLGPCPVEAIVGVTVHVFD